MILKILLTGRNRGRRTWLQKGQKHGNHGRWMNVESGMEESWMLHRLHQHCSRWTLLIQSNMAWGRGSGHVIGQFLIEATCTPSYPRCHHRGLKICTTQVQEKRHACNPELIVSRPRVRNLEMSTILLTVTAFSVMLDKCRNLSILSLTYEQYV